MSRTDSSVVGAPRLADLGTGVYAWLQASGGWGLANAGLVVGEGTSLLVDTLFDLRLTTRMLAGLAGLTDAAPIGTVVNTHGNGDHWFGNELVPEAEVLASEAAAAEMRLVGPDEVQELFSLVAPGGAFARGIFGAFHFDEITPRYPTRTFSGRLSLDVGGTAVELIEVGPAHTAGDVLIHVPSARTVFTGDIVFNGGTPIIWEGPVSGWLAACDVLTGLDVDTVVPGHGPVGDKDSVHEAATYLRFVHERASATFAAGLEPEEAARAIARDDGGRFSTLPESERLVANVHAVYQDLDPSRPQVRPPDLFGCMAELHQDMASTATGGR
jgi:glyoxylase-like metal-dependent hydrolase (beta-lactamase superfamily II)